MTSQTNKEILLKLCKKINKANNETIEILRSQPLCNLKMVQRRAKNIKDPNPLSSMMSTITTKFPISVDLAKAKDINMPEEFLSHDDAHQYGRALCKLEAVEWYLSRAILPNEDIIKAIKVLYYNKKEEVSSYFSFAWENSIIVPGQTFINRMIINTQEPLVQIPNSQKTNYIMACLMPEYILDYDQLSPMILGKLKDIRDLKLVSKMTIQSQLRILINSLNPRPRCIPCLSEANVEVNRMRHAFASSNYTIRVTTTIRREPSSHNSLIDKIGKALFLKLRERREAGKLFKRLKESTLNGEPLVNVIEREPDLEGTYINYLLVFMKFPVQISTKIGFFRMIPIEGITHSQNAITLSGAHFTIYIGEEKIQLQGVTIRGFFKHNSTTILGITLTKSDRNTLTNAIVAIAEYCRFNYYTVPGRNLRELKRNARQYYESNPWEIVGCGKQEWKKVLKYENVGLIKFEEEVELMVGKKERGRIEGDKIKFNSGHSVTVFAPRDVPIFPTNYSILGIDFSDFTHPRQRFMVKFEYFIHNINIVKDCINKGKFIWENNSMMEGVPRPIRKAVAHTAQSFIYGIIDRDISTPILAFLFLFSGEEIDAMNPNINTYDFPWFNNYQVSFTMDKGIFKYSENGLLIFDDPYKNYTSEEVDKYLPTFLSGYTFMQEPDETREYKSIEYLRNKEKDIPDGTLFNISVFGRTHLICRDQRAKLALKRTLMRNMVSLSTTGALENILLISRLQKRGANTDDGPGPSKRVCLETYNDGEVDPFDDDDGDFDCE